MKELKYKPDEYVAAFRRIAVAPHHMRMLQAHYHAPQHTLTATQMSKTLGYPKHSAANLHYGRLGRLIGEELGWRPLPDQTVFVLVTFEKPSREWHWIMHPAFAAALEQLGWIKGEHAEIPEELDMTTPLYEGAVKRIAVNAYQRSGAAREKCSCITAVAAPHMWSNSSGPLWRNGARIDSRSSCTPAR